MATTRIIPMHVNNNLSENVSFQTFFLSILHKFVSEKGNQRGIHPLFF